MKREMAEGKSQTANRSSHTWVLMDADNPYRVAYYGGCDEDPALPYMTDMENAIRYPDFDSARRATEAIFDRHERGFFEVPGPPVVWQP